jgi:hypothetical protein
MFLQWVPFSPILESTDLTLVVSASGGSSDILHLRMEFCIAYEQRRDGRRELIGCTKRLSASFWPRYAEIFSSHALPVLLK